MIRGILNFLFKPFNLAKVKVYLFGILSTLFIANILYIKLSNENEFLEIWFDNSSPTIISIFLLVIFAYMIFVDFKDSKRKQNNRKVILDMIGNPNLSESLKEKLINKLDDNL